MQDDERIIELIAKALDEPLTASEQAEVDQAIQNSLALRVAADGLHEFDALLKRTGMALPDEGFPARFLLRLEAYERSRTRTQWLLTLGIIFLGSLAALAWLALNWNIFLDAIIFLAASLLLFIPLGLAILFTLVQAIGTGPLLIYALIVLALTLLWARVSGNWNPTRA